MNSYLSRGIHLGLLAPLILAFACGGDGGGSPGPADAGVPPPMCGNGTLETGELCDGTAFGGKTCVSEGFSGGSLACATTCGALDTSSCSVCGNGRAEPGELCDGSDLASQTCTTQGFPGGQLACAPTCDAFVTSFCTKCNNGVLEAGEVCDSFNLNGQTCVSQGFSGGTLACGTTCTSFATAACTVCNNGTLEPGEVCDGTNLNGQNCATQGFAGGGTLACGATCFSFNTSGCVGAVACGNGVLEAGEQCDDGNRVNGDGCNANCTLPACGNGIVDAVPGELCYGAAVAVGVSSPRAVAIGDLDGRNGLDLVVVDDANDRVVLRLNDGTGQFPVLLQQVKTLAAGASPRGVAVGDIDGNGTLDVVTANDGLDSVTVLFNDGTGNLNFQASFSVAGSGGGGTRPRAVALANLDAVAGLEIVTANNGDDTVSVLFNNGLGLFGNERVLTAGVGPAALTLSDFNRDGRLDIGAANDGSGDVSVFFGDAGATFAIRARFSVGSAPGGGPVGLAAGDFDGGNGPDLVSVDPATNGAAILVNNGSGILGGGTSVGVGAMPRAVAVGNLNSDSRGNLDFVAANAGASTVTVRTGNGAAQFPTSTNFNVGAGPIAVATGDLNGDTVLDLVTANRASNSLSVLLSAP